MGSPFSGGLGGPVFGQAEVPDLLPSRPLQDPGQFLTSPESGGLDLQAQVWSRLNCSPGYDWLHYQRLSLGPRSTPGPRFNLAPLEF